MDVTRRRRRLAGPLALRATFYPIGWVLVLVHDLPSRDATAAPDVRALGTRVRNKSTGHCGAHNMDFERLRGGNELYLARPL